MIISARNRRFNMTIDAPPSKSVYHRELIVRFLCGDREHLEDKALDSNDIKATRACLRSLRDHGTDKSVTLPCGESGSTLRFMIPVASAFLLAKGEEKAERIVFTTEGRLFERPVKELSDAMRAHGITIEEDPENRCFVVSGSMTPGRYEIDGGVSSQYISGLLMALPLFDDISMVEVRGQIKSGRYIDLTMDALSKYGAPVRREGNVFFPSFGGYKKIEDSDFRVEGDWSNGAFLLCLSRFCDIKIRNLDPDSKQGDKAILEFMNAIEEKDNVSFDCSDIPDIVPYMAVTAAFSVDRAVFSGIGRLRIKESDRVSAIREQLGAVGVKTKETTDTLTVFGTTPGEAEYEVPVRLSSYNDHRMAMCAILIAVILGTEADIDDIDCLDKSFPEFKEIVRREMMP